MPCCAKRQPCYGLAVAALLVSSWTVLLQAREPTKPGLHDVVVYDPGVHERQLPSPQLNQYGPGLQVDIPPAVHVHRYYYSGDREVQGPLITGGPTVVVCNHPFSGERLYIDVVLPAGAPKIAYNGRSITYVYPDERVSLQFNRVRRETAAVVYRKGQGVSRTVDDYREKVSADVRERLEGSPLLQAARDTASGTRDFVRGGVDTLGSTTAGLTERLGGALNIIPGVTYLRTRGQQFDERRYLNGIEGAERRNARNAIPFLPTNR